MGPWLFQESVHQPSVRGRRFVFGVCIPLEHAVIRGNGIARFLHFPRRGWHGAALQKCLYGSLGPEVAFDRN